MCSRYYTSCCIQQNCQMHFIARSQALKTLSSTLPIALDDTLPACLTIRSQVSSQNALKHTPEYAVARKSVSHHHRHSAWQRTELRRVYGDTGMTEMDWATGADGDTGVTEMEGATGSIYLGDPGVDRLSSHLVSSYHTTNYTLYHSQLLISLALSEISWIHAIAWILTAG